MSSSNHIMLRVQSSEGNKRIEIKPNDSISKLFEKVHEAFSLTGFAFALFRERNNRGEIISSRSKTVAGSGLQHGDLLYMAAQNGAKLWAAPSSNPVDMAGPSTSSVTPVSPPPATPSPSGSREKSVTGVDYVTNHNGRSSNGTQEDEVDQLLWKMDGKIERKRDEKLCRHLRNGRCLHCSPLEPYDEAYLKEQNVKHMSFHAFLRKLTAGMDRGKFVCLEDMSCRIKPGCKGHLPWPHGICTKCQPNAVTLNRQVYRHVDNAMFENAHLVERFLNYWRTTGHQRIGYLYGRHEIHADVPLGIRATVAAIYEPPQESTRDQIKLLLDEKEAVVEELASQLGLKRVGWIFTDLVAEDLSKGTVKHVRNINSHFLSAQECIMAGHFQNRHPNPCRFSSSGYFGSKFVTICVTGDVSNQVHMEGYSVSNQCMALVRDQCLLPTKDAPELGYIKDSTSQQFVPDVYYKEKDSYGNEVPRMARPLPVEYLLVDVPASTPLTPLFTFQADNNIRPFAVENRLVDGHIQDFAALSSYLRQFPPEHFLAAVSDFHFLLYIATMETLPMKEHMGVLLAAVREGDGEAAAEWARGDHWATMEQLMAAAGRGGGGAERSPSGSDQAMPQAPEWTCPHCTFLNLPHHNTCDMCSLPR